MNRNSLGQIQSSSMIWHSNQEIPLHTEDSFKYDSSGMLLSYVKTINHDALSSRANALTANRNMIKRKCIEFLVEDGLVLEEVEKDSCLIVSNKTNYEYDSKGNRTKESIDSMEPQIHFIEGRTEKGVQRFSYKFDKRGNWIKRYYVFNSGKRTLEVKRKIKYRKSAYHNMIEKSRTNPAHSRKKDTALSMLRSIRKVR